MLQLTQRRRSYISWLLCSSFIDQRTVWPIRSQESFFSWEHLPKLLLHSLWSSSTKSNWYERTLNSFLKILQFLIPADPRGLVTEEFLASLHRKSDDNGGVSSTTCNRNNLHLQTSIKTGPQCVDGSKSPGSSTALQLQAHHQPLITQPQSHRSEQQILHMSQPTSVQVSPDGQPSSSSGGSGSGVVVNSSSIGSNKSFGDVASGKSSDGEYVFLRTGRSQSVVSLRSLSSSATSQSKGLMGKIKGNLNNNNNVKVDL